RADLALVRELVPRRLPYLAAVVRALDLLPEPAARLRRVEAVRVGRGGPQVGHLPARQMRAVRGPLLALARRRQDQRAPPRADQDSDSAHVRSLPRVSTARSDLSIAGSGAGAVDAGASSPRLQAFAATARRRVISSGETSSMCVATPHSCPNGSRSLP